MNKQEQLLERLTKIMEVYNKTNDDDAILALTFFSNNHKFSSGICKALLGILENKNEISKFDELLLLSLIDNQPALDKVKALELLNKNK